MKEGLLEKIKASGYWRINLRPARTLEKELTLKHCREVVAAANVSLRGWDYPHVANRNDDQVGYGNNDGFIENWTEWKTMLEFWRMYQSGQFLHYRNMWEDYEEVEHAPQKPFLSIVGAIYVFTEVAEFANRLATNSGYPEGVDISIAAVNTVGRRLWVGGNRMPFIEPMTTGVERVEVTGTLLTGASTIPPIDIASQLLMSFFDQFGWQPNLDQIRSDQERLLKRQF